MQTFEAVFMVKHDGDYTTYLQVHPEGVFDNDSEVEEAALAHIEKVFGIKHDKLTLLTVDEIG